MLVHFCLRLLLLLLLHCSTARSKVYANRKWNELQPLPLSQTQIEDPQPPVVLTDEERLFKKLMLNYEPVSRPVYNASKAVVVLFGLALIQIQNMDEVDQVLSTYVWFEQNWVDERLKWNPSDYNNLRVFRVPSSKIWSPDIVLYNSADEHSYDRQMRAMISHDGAVFYAPPVKICSSCRIDITYYPFDIQECKLKFGSWTYDNSQMELVNKSDRVDLTNYMANGEWGLEDVSVVQAFVEYVGCPGELYPDLTFIIKMRRRSLFYWTNILFPCIWLTVINIVSFALPPDSGERVTLGISVFLSFSVFMLLVAENIPPTSDTVPLLSQYLTVAMTLNAVCLLVAIVLHNFHHSSPFARRPLPEWAKKLMLQVIGPALGMSVADCERRAERMMSSSSVNESFRSSHKESFCNKSFRNSQSQPSFKTLAKRRKSPPSLQTVVICNGTGLPETAKNNKIWSALLGKNNRNNDNKTEDVAQNGDANKDTESHLTFKQLLKSNKWKTLQHSMASKSPPDSPAEKLADNVCKLLRKQTKNKISQGNIIKEWKMFTNVLDRVLLYLFLFVSIVTNFIYLILIPLVSP